MKRYLLFAALSGIGLAAPTPGHLAGFPYTCEEAATNDLSGTVQLQAGQPLKAIMHKSPKVIAPVEALVQEDFSLKDNGYTFSFERAHYDPKRDVFHGDAALSGAGVPDRVFANDVTFNSKGILSVGQISSFGSGTAHTPWSVGGGTLTPDGLVWADHELSAKGLFLKGKFYATAAVELKNGTPVALKLLKPTKMLDQARIAYVQSIKLVKGDVLADGYVLSPHAKKWIFKNVAIAADGKLRHDLPLSWKQPDIEALAADPRLMASTSGVPSGDSLTPQERAEMFRLTPALEVAQTKGLQILKVEGAPNLQMVVTQSAQGGDKVDGFIPLQHWVGQANVYGGTRNADKGTVKVSDAQMQWLKKTVVVPSGFGTLTLMDPVVLNPATGRLSSPCTGTGVMRGVSAGVIGWNVDQSQFRLQCGTFLSADANVAQVDGTASSGFMFNAPPQNVANAAPPKGTMPDQTDDLQSPKLSFQGGSEFDVVFLDDGTWGFEFRMALPQFDIGGPSWFRRGTLKALPGVPLPNIFLKMYSNKNTFVNVAAQNLSIPLADTGLAFASPGLLFFYQATGKLFFFVLQASVNIVDVDPNIFTSVGKLYVDGSGMGKSGGGEIALRGYVLDCEVAELDVGFRLAGDEKDVSLTATLAQLFGFIAIDGSGEVRFGAPPKEWDVGVSAYISLGFLGKLGLTFYGYSDPKHVSVSWGGHEFHAVEGGDGSAVYTGPYELLGVNWFGTEALNGTQGTLTANGNSSWSATSPDGSGMTCNASLTNATVATAGIAGGSMAATDVNITLNPGGANLVNVKFPTMNFVNDQANKQLAAKMDTPVTINNTTVTVPCEVELKNTGELTLQLDLPQAQGGTYSQAFTLVSTGVNKTHGQRPRGHGLAAKGATHD